ncbi:cdeb85d4-6c24-486b-9e91-ce472c9b660c [Thermothielavioides terrestris]|uniref:Cdeb85d4-6c24-486b-9e91-ce472c9b660c n=1 Tax=Thermothielavioides terrestris TaxID=2587410 RepID=A0A3S4D6V3_9PEZI|nr:cdeb85d4-6c24-486b-9e91-ce472c9b660c [Thermothielavioides terrestris]
MKYRPSLSLAAAALFLLEPWVQAQLSGSVGPTTSRAAKAAKKVCNIMNYGGVASATTDNSAAITAAWNACKGGGEVYIPSGSYGLSSWVTLSGGSGVSINLEGVIYRITSATAGGTMISVSSTTDFEFYSGNSKGAIQGYGYLLNANGANSGPRLVRLTQVTNFSFHDIALVDAPEFSLVMDTCSNGEVYNSIVRAGSEGGLDGVDVWGQNIWIHDIEVTNKDECVTVKSPASNILVESIFCNWSGGSAMGSLGANTDISNIYYRNVYSQNCNQMYMIKSWGGSGTVKNVKLENFWGHSNAYTLDLNAYWTSMTQAPGDGVSYQNITFTGWKGTNSNGAQRGSIQVLCPSAVPCTGITISDVNIWTESGSTEKEICENANYAIQTMPNEIKTWGLGTEIPIPAIPTSFFPGLRPISALMAASSNGGGPRLPQRARLRRPPQPGQAAGSSPSTCL